jgi:hypothetical protein
MGLFCYDSILELSTKNGLEVTDFWRSISLPNSVFGQKSSWTEFNFWVLDKMKLWKSRIPFRLVTFSAFQWSIIRLQRLAIYELWLSELNRFSESGILADHTIRRKSVLWLNHLRNEGPIFPDADRVILKEARIQQAHIRSIQNHNFIKN